MPSPRAASWAMSRLGLPRCRPSRKPAEESLTRLRIADVRRRQQRQVVALDAPRRAIGVIVDEVDLAAEDRLDPVLAAGLVELDRAVHHAVVGEPEGGLAELGGALGEARRSCTRRRAASTRSGRGGGSASAVSPPRRPCSSPAAWCGCCCRSGRATARRRCRRAASRSAGAPRGLGGCRRRAARESAAAADAPAPPEGAPVAGAAGARRGAGRLDPRVRATTGAARISEPFLDRIRIATPIQERSAGYDAAVADFDLVAASLRADSGDVRGYCEALAVRLETALPTQTTVKRRSGLDHVVRVRLALRRRLAVVAERRVALAHGRPHAVAARRDR